MAEIKTIEQLIYFMKGHIHLSKYDERFIENISTLNQVTTNQVVLLHTLIEKYRRQFAKHELYPEKLFDLPWNVTVVESSPKYTNGHVEIVNGMIYFKCPFSRNFIDNFRKESLNPYTFNKEKRRYEAPYNQYSLKLLLKIAPKFFNAIDFCPVTQTLVEQIKQFENEKYWEPTLVRLNGRLYIVGMSSALNDALGDLVLNTDLHTLNKLTTYGITISEDLYNDSLKENFACNHTLTVEQAELQELVAILKEFNCDMVYLTGAGLLNLSKKTIIDLLNKAQIPYADNNSKSEYVFPVTIKLRKNSSFLFDDNKTSKVIYVVNSLPIDIK